MSTYTKTYATRDLYLTAKASGGEIYNIVSGISSGSASVVSRITDTGETFVDSVNQIVPREAGQIGDILICDSLYKGEIATLPTASSSNHKWIYKLTTDSKFYRCTSSTSGSTTTYSWVNMDGPFQWCKGGAYDASAYGGTTHSKTALENAGWTCVGWLVERRGNQCWIGSYEVLSGTKNMCSDNTTHIDNIFINGGVMRGNGTLGYKNWIGSANMRYAEEKYGSTGNIYVLPITRATWNNRTTTDPITGLDGISINRNDYDFNFDEYYRQRVLIKMPLHTVAKSTSTSGYAQADEDGRGNTNALLAAVTSSFTCPAATAANGYTVSGVTGFDTAGNWYIPALGQVVMSMVHYYRLKKAGLAIGSKYIWSSTQYADDYCWCLRFPEAYVRDCNRTGTISVWPFADFQI